jgi:single-stranded-DNA-specific exonuclease
MKHKKRKSIIKYLESDSIVDKLLKIRGISDKQRFLFPSSKEMHSPHLLTNIKVVAEKIIDAVKKGKRIAVSCDPDTDGISSTALMVRYLTRLTNNVYIVYAQRGEGHGIECQLDQIEEGTDLLIILDSSTNSIEALQQLHERRIDIVILDHHDQERKNKYGIDNPYATIVNPKLDNTYPNEMISGSGVTYKMLQVLDETFGTGEVEDLIDLAGFGMYADMMPCDVLENRYMIIEAMKNIKNPGLLAILKFNDISLDKINAQTIGFTISPLINGVARKDRIELAIQLLLNDDFEECMKIVAEMKILNDERREDEKRLFEQYVSKINVNDKVLIAIDENASKNYNGLIANRIAQEFKKPAIVMRSHEGTLAGSYRGFGSVNMEEFLNQKQIRKYLNYAVGHGYAGGVALKESNLEAFKDVINKALEGVDLESVIEYDIEINGEELSEDLITEIEIFDYLTGTGFPPATFLVKDLFVEDEVKVMGKNKDTVKIPCDYADVIKFKTNDKWASDVSIFDSINVVGQLKVNRWTNWKGVTTVTSQVVAEGYKIV